jgi:streptogramin lyase
LIDRAPESFVLGLGHWRRIVGAAGTAVVVGAGALVGAALPASAAPVGQVHEYSHMHTTNSSPQGIAKDAAGNLWFTEFNGNKIGRITPSGVVTEFGGLTGTSPASIAAGPDGNMWFTEFIGKKIGRISPTGVVQEFTTGINQADGYVQGIAKGPDGKMWFTEPNGNRVGKISTTGVVTEYTIGITPGSFPYNIVAGPDGNMWFTEYAGARIGKITPTGAVTEYHTGITPNSHPWGIAKGPDGNLWFTEATGNRIGRITTDGVVHQFSNGSPDSDKGLRWIVAGPDGNMWFTELEAQRVARITTAGVITQFSAGITGQANPIGITAGPSRNMWFTEGLGNRIARIGTDPTMTCKVKGGTLKPKLKVICHVTVVSPSAKVKWKVKRHGLVAKNHTKLKHGKLVINLSHVAVHKGKNKVAVTVGKGARKFVLHQTVRIHKR